jgi:hypothetical protein
VTGLQLSSGQRQFAMKVADQLVDAVERLDQHPLTTDDVEKALEKIELVRLELLVVRANAYRVNGQKVPARRGDEPNAAESLFQKVQENRNAP